MNFFFIFVLIIFKLKLNLTEFIENPIIYSGDWDPSTKLLPKDWLNHFIQNINNAKIFSNETNFSKRKNVFKESLTSLNETCKNPSEFELIKLLTQHYHDHYDINFISMKTFESFHKNNQNKELLIVDALSSFQNHETKIISTHGSLECSLNIMNTIDKHTPLCPWHYSIIQRHDRYPFKRMTAFCNCKSTCLLNSTAKSINNYKCVPIKLSMPVLIRGKCHNGFYKWNNAIEDVPSSCACVAFN